MRQGRKWEELLTYTYVGFRSAFRVIATPVYGMIAFYTKGQKKKWYKEQSIVVGASSVCLTLTTVPEKEKKRVR